MSWNGKRKWTKADWASWAIAVFALIMMAIALLSIEARADELPEPLPTLASTSWVAPQATFTPVLQPWPQVTPAIVYLPLINAKASAGVCTIARFKRGMFAKLTGNPGGDGALYVKIDGELITWFSRQGAWFYVTSRKGVAVYGYDSAGNLECGG